MKNKNNNKNRQQENPENKKFDPEQYKILKRCSDKKDITEWKKYREAHPGKEILLEGADLLGAHLEGADLSGAHLEGAKLRRSHLEGAKLSKAHLEETKFDDANLRGTRFLNSHFESANFKGAISDGETILIKCFINRDTDFRAVGLDNIRIDAGTKYRLKYNSRRKNWQQWYKNHKFLQFIARPFWWFTDYGTSAKRIISTFSIAAFIFAAVYYSWGCIDLYLLDNEESPGIVANLFFDENGLISAKYVPLRAVYFSIVTMTTLGFGDMYAQPNGCAGHILLMAQVILGYILLGALITYFGTLFTAGGPLAKLSKTAKQAKKDKS